MPKEGRSKAKNPGGTFFFTLVTHDRLPLLADPSVLAGLRAAIADTRRDRPFTIEAIVILPDHLHCIWTLPPFDADFWARWRLIKSRFARACAKTRFVSRAAGPARSGRGVTAIAKRATSLWQRRFWEHTIQDEADLARHADFIHYNPVKHRLASCPHAWPHSSFGQWVRLGRYPMDWCCRCGASASAARESWSPPDFSAIEENAGEV